LLPLKKTLLLLLIVAAAAAAYLLLAATRVQPVAWQAPPAPSLTQGPYAHNQRLKDIQRIGRIAQRGPESLAVDVQGNLYAGYDDGSVVRFDADGNHPQRIANTSGRPLGMAVMPIDGDLIVADAFQGLLRIDAQGHVSTLVDAKGSLHLGFTDDVAVDRGGSHAYFTDASRKWGYGDYRFDLLEHGGHGRLLRYDFASGTTSVLLSGLQFANGVALGPDDAYVLVVATGAYRVLRYWLRGPRVGTTDVFVDDLPCLPDNIRYNGRDRFWLACPSPRDPVLDALSGNVFARKIVARMLGVFTPPLKRFAMVAAYDTDGHLITQLQYTGPGAYRFITQATEAGPWLYFSSLYGRSLGRMPLRQALAQPSLQRASP
jgi:sugar lactone lactonase YvrE